MHARAHFRDCAQLCVRWRLPRASASGDAKTEASFGRAHRRRARSVRGRPRRDSRRRVCAEPARWRALEGEIRETLVAEVRERVGRRRANAGAEPAALARSAAHRRAASSIPKPQPTAEQQALSRRRIPRPRARGADRRAGGRRLHIPAHGVGRRHAGNAPRSPPPAGLAKLRRPR